MLKLPTEISLDTSMHTVPRKAPGHGGLVIVSTEAAVSLRTEYNGCQGLSVF